MFLADHRIAPPRRLLLPLGAGLIILTSALKGPALADNATFVISANEGYGIIDCLADGVACGRIVADAWCEAHGKGPAVAFGLAADVTASIGKPVPKTQPGDVIISCGE